jgi:hypothetical protein
VASLLADVVGYTGELLFDSTKPDGMPRKMLDAGPLYALGWRPSTELPAALRATHAWFEANVIGPGPFSPVSEKRGGPARPASAPRCSWGEYRPVSPKRG